jgi:hypothetical protein
MNTKKLLFVALMMMCAITVHALQLREGHFFKTFSDVQPMVKAAPALFDQWFALPEDTEWREVSRQTDNIGMERIEYRQYVGGVEVEYSQVLLHVRDGRVQYATSQSQYADIRLCHLQAAKDLYGDNSSEVQAVAKAWDIVGVTDDSAPTAIQTLNVSPSTRSDDWHTIGGIRLSQRPTAKGIYIYKGRKVVIK